jgi:tetratricopeptide (TPR) repeat protein
MKWFLLLASLLTALASHAQKTAQARIDSLLNELPNAQEDTAKVNLLSDLSQSYLFINPDEQLKYAKLALELAQKLGDEIHLAKAYNVLGNAYSCRGNSDEAILNHMHALVIADKYGNEQMAIGLKINIGLECAQQEKVDDALDYLEAALKSSKKLGDDELISYSYQNLSAAKFQMASAYHNKNETRKAQKMLNGALNDLNAAIEIHKKSNNKMALALGYQGLGDIYIPMQNLAEAENSYNTSLSLAKEIEIKEIEARDHLGIARICFIRKDYARAEDECKMAMSIGKEIGNSDIVQRASSLSKTNKEAAQKSAPLVPVR